MSKIWFTADQHFNHKNIIKYDERPFSDVDEMNQVMIDRWNEVVAEEDTVYHLGDFGFGSIANQKKHFDQLKGKKELILGNHDKLSKSLAIGWDNIQRWKLLDGILLCHKPDLVEHWPGFIIHGHTHKPSESPNKLCVSCNLWDYYPVSYDVVKDYISNENNSD